MILDGRRANGILFTRGGSAFRATARQEVILAAGAIGSPPAFINALTDALGVKDIAMPATAEKVWRVANGIA